MAESLWRAMFCWQPGSEIVGGDLLVRMIGSAATFPHLGPNTFELRHGWSGLTDADMALLFALSVFVIYGARSTATASASKTDRRPRWKN